MNIPIFLDKVPKEYMQITKKTTVKSVRKFLEKYKFDKIEFLVNDKTESKIFDTDKYDNFDLSSIWTQLKNPAIYLTSSLISSTLTDTLSEFKLEILILKTPTTECLKVSFLRKKYGNDIDLEKWMNIDNNLYVGRMGRIFITNKQKEKKVFHYKSSKWANPYKVGLKDYTLEESLKLYEKYIIDNNLIKDLQELNGKNLGCFCDQNNNCHAKVLAELFRINDKN